MWGMVFSGEDSDCGGQSRMVDWTCVKRGLTGAPLDGFFPEFLGVLSPWVCGPDTRGGDWVGLRERVLGKGSYLWPSRFMQRYRPV